jgi:hypothetical protein
MKPAATSRQKLAAIICILESALHELTGTKSKEVTVPIVSLIARQSTNIENLTIRQVLQRNMRGALFTLFVGGFSIIFQRIDFYIIPCSPLFAKS